MKQKQARKAPESAEEWVRQHRRGFPGKILSDPAVQTFVEEHICSMSFVELAAECRDRFGEKRAPSKSAIGRHWQRNRDRLLSKHPA